MAGGVWEMVHAHLLVDFYFLLSFYNMYLLLGYKNLHVAPAMA